MSLCCHRWAMQLWGYHLSFLNLYLPHPSFPRWSLRRPRPHADQGSCIAPLWCHGQIDVMDGYRIDSVMRSSAACRTPMYLPLLWMAFPIFFSPMEMNFSGLQWQTAQWRKAKHPRKEKRSAIMEGGASESQGECETWTPSGKQNMKPCMRSQLCQPKGTVYLFRFY